jgi:dienelactone hydrolase
MNDESASGGLTPELLPSWHEAALGAMEFPLGWKEPCADPEAWKRRGREAFLNLLLEDRAPVDPEPRVLAVEERDGYRVSLLSLSLGRFRRQRAYLAMPEGAGPFPAALLLHDHGAFFDIGKEKTLRPLSGDPKAAASAAWMEKNYGGRSVGDELAKRGWAVLSADALGWGDRAGGGYEGQQAIASNLFNLGSSWAGLIAVEDMAAAAFLSSLPGVDPARLASIGHSMGAFRSWQVAALSDRVGACVAVCGFGTVAGLMAPGGNRLRGQSAYAMTHPGLSKLMDFPDLAALAAPKPMLMIHGLSDPLYPEACARQACAKTAAAYRAFGAGEGFRADFRPGGHVFSVADQEEAFKWLDGIASPRS